MATVSYIFHINIPPFNSIFHIKSHCACLNQCMFLKFKTTLYGTSRISTMVAFRLWGMAALFPTEWCAFRGQIWLSTIHDTNYGSIKWGGLASCGGSKNEQLGMNSLEKTIVVMALSGLKFFFDQTFLITGPWWVFFWRGNTKFTEVQ